MESSKHKFLKNSSADKKMSCKEQAEFLLLIGKLMKNGFSLNQSIKCLMYLDKDNKVFANIYHDLQDGIMLSTALKHLNLPAVVQNQLVISQMNGGIQQTVIQCGNILKSKAKQQTKLRELLMYPMFIMGFLTVMIIGMKVIILPQLQSSAGGANLDLVFQFAGIGLIFAVVGLIAGSIYLRRLSEYDRAKILVKLPIINQSYLHFYQFTILQGWGLQFSKGMDLHQICLSNQIFSEGSIQNVLAKKILDCMKNGDSLEKVIDKELLLPNELNMIFCCGGGIGEMASDILLISELKYESTQTSIKKLLNLVQPVLFGIIAIFILVAYLMILLPVYGMMKGMN
ncbi:competence protein ComG [Companilactobacillus ginsenosidimutans]|uniref:Competence protein ComG n=2 Tax=Companilactobacillus ginsenosidimutans TaxID=1007676 RepID=A0A0H4R3X9_9LACO|nr:competence protein ComG [Companilactobacillus ginsenosidimutans]